MGRYDKAEKKNSFEGNVAREASKLNASGRDPARDSALARAVQQIEKQFGKGAVMKLDGAARTNIDGIPTGSLSLDIALGGVGVPKGRVLEIFGPESSGKTTLTLHIIANCQKTGGVAAFIDAEHALDPSWAKRLGVKLDELMVSQPDTRRAGAGDLRDARPLQRGRRDRHRLRRRPDPPGRDRGRDGRCPRRSAGPAHEPGPPQADRGHQQVQVYGDLHQPDPREDRRDVRQPRDHPRWSGP